MTHAPKWRALIALDADALSERGVARVRHHLEQCETCARALAEIQAFETVARETRETPIELDWSKMELALRREARTQSQAIRAAKRRRSWLLPAAALVAAAAVAAVVVWKTTEAPTPIAEETAPVVPPVVPEAEAVGGSVAGLVVAVAGIPQRGDEPIALGDSIHEGDRLEVAARHALHAVLGPNTAIALLGAAQLTANRLRTDGIELDLVEGRVSSTVQEGTEFTIVAAPYEVHARGTRFRVDRRDGVVTVTLEEGSVEVTRDGERVAQLDAPARWSSDPEVRAPSETAVAVPTIDEARTLALQLPASDTLLHWQIDEEALPAGATGALLLAPGEHEVVGYDAEGHRFETTLALVDEGISLDERALQRVRTAPRVGYLSPEQIRGTVDPTIRRLRSCYERDLRRTDPHLGGSYTLRVRVAPDGSVRRVTVQTDDDLPHTLRNCLVRHASAWTFPEPEGDGPVTFDLPLNLRTR